MQLISLALYMAKYMHLLVNDKRSLIVCVLKYQPLKFPAKF